MGIERSESDTCIYSMSNDELVIGVYVDDIILAGRSVKQLNEVKKAHADKFDVKDLGELNYFLGVNVKINQNSGMVWIGNLEWIMLNR